MKKLAATAAAFLVAAATLASPALAQSGDVSISFGEQRSFIEDRCDRNPTWRGCDDFNDNWDDWGRDDYAQWYRWNRPHLGALGFGLFAFALGAAAANAADDDDFDDFDSDWEDHVAACEARYRSYDEDTDMYLSYNNGYQRCRL
jgi:hypothetical protein